VLEEEVVGEVEVHIIFLVTLEAYLWYQLLKKVYWWHWLRLVQQFSKLLIFSPYLWHKAKSFTESLVSSLLTPWVGCHQVSSLYYLSNVFISVEQHSTWRRLPTLRPVLDWAEQFRLTLAFTSSLWGCQPRFHQVASTQILHVS